MISYIQNKWLANRNKMKLETRNKKTIQIINEIRRCLFERINKFDKPLTRVIKKKREGTNYRSGKKEYITNSLYIKKTLKNIINNLIIYLTL